MASPNNAINRILVVVLVSLILCANPSKGQGTVQPRPAADRTHDFLGLGAPPDKEAAERGSKVYSSTCAFCHGAKATGGDSGPDLLRSTLVLHDEKGELIGPVIHNGRVARGMPSFASFTDAELYDIAEFLHLRVELAANRGTYKLLNVITGDAKAGKIWFDGVGGCKSCHSATGNLAHIGSKLSPPELQQAVLYPAAPGSAPKVTVILASGEKVTGTLKHLDDFNVTLLDGDSNLHSIALTDQTRVVVEDRLAKHRELLDRYTDADMHNITAYLVTLK